MGDALQGSNLHSVLEDLVDERKVMFFCCGGECLLCLFIRFLLLSDPQSVEVSDEFSQILMGDLADQSIFEEGQKGGINLPLVIDIERLLGGG